MGKRGKNNRTRKNQATRRMEARAIQQKNGRKNHHQPRTTAILWEPTLWEMDRPQREHEERVADDISALGLILAGLKNTGSQGVTPLKLIIEFVVEDHNFYNPRDRSDPSQLVTTDEEGYFILNNHLLDRLGSLLPGVVVAELFNDMIEHIMKRMNIIIWEEFYHHPDSGKLSLGVAATCEYCMYGVVIKINKAEFQDYTVCDKCLNRLPTSLFN